MSAVFEELLQRFSQIEQSKYRVGSPAHLPLLSDEPSQRRLVQKVRLRSHGAI